MNEHVGMPGERLEILVRVIRVVVNESPFGPVAEHTLEWNGNILFWAASSNGTWLQAGENYNVRVFVKGYDKDEDGVKRTVVTRVSLNSKKEEVRIPRVAIGIKKRR